MKMGGGGTAAAPPLDFLFIPPDPPDPPSFSTVIVDEGVVGETTEIALMSSMLAKVWFAKVRSYEIKEKMPQRLDNEGVLCKTWGRIALVPSDEV